MTKLFGHSGISHLQTNALLQAGFKYTTQGIFGNCYKFSLEKGSLEYDYMPTYNRFGFIYRPIQGAPIFTKLNNCAEAIEWAKQILF